MSNQELFQKIQAQFPNAVSEEQYDILNITVSSDEALKVLTSFKDELGYTYLNDLTAVHYPEQDGKELCVVYLLQDIYRSHRVRIKAFLNILKPDIYTATSLFSTANWLEREAYDFYGVNFIGHPNLKRIMNVDEMDYFPLRKEYPLEDQSRIDKDDEMFGRDRSLAFKS
jgi:NADH-quinone oxidoreductase subunit C